MRARLVLTGVAITVVSLVAAGCGGGGGETTTTEPPATTAPTTTASGSASGDAARGKEVFASAGCGGCHTFAAAGATGSVGPNLDDTSPSFDKVVSQVTNGGGPMPAFKDSLSEQQIRDVATFVSGSSS